jgi:hypothetical protein
MANELTYEMPEICKECRDIWFGCEACEWIEEG